MGHEKDIADVVDKTSSMASSVMHEGLDAAIISTYENMCKTVDILLVKLQDLRQLE